MTWRMRRPSFLGFVCIARRGNSLLSRVLSSPPSPVFVRRWLYIQQLYLKNIGFWRAVVSGRQWFRYERRGFKSNRRVVCVVLPQAPWTVAKATATATSSRAAASRNAQRSATAIGISHGGAARAPRRRDVRAAATTTTRQWQRQRQRQQHQHETRPPAVLHTNARARSRFARALALAVSRAWGTRDRP